MSAALTVVQGGYGFVASVSHPPNTVTKGGKSIGESP